MSSHASDFVKFAIIIIIMIMIMMIIIITNLHEDYLGFNGGNRNSQVDPGKSCFIVQRDNVTLLLAAVTANS